MPGPGVVGHNNADEDVVSYVISYQREDTLSCTCSLSVHSPTHDTPALAQAPKSSPWNFVGAGEYLPEPKKYYLEPD